MMRQIIVDTETTGLDPKLGHRVIEIAAVEIVDRRHTGNHFHRYVNPGRVSDDGALQIHGLTDEFLRDKPRFSDIANEFLDFVRDAELIIHNAAFDCEFLDVELALFNLKPITAHCRKIIDTLELIVIAASTEELTEHELQLAAIDNVSNGACVWKKLAMTTLQ